MSHLALASLAVAAYLLGGVPFGLLLGFLRGVDIRKIGSGNVGATNLSRAIGKSWGVAAFLLDFTKGLLPVLLAGHLASAIDDGSGPSGNLPPVLAGLAAILGHVFSPYLRFRGGKGVATTFGVMAALSWPSTLAAGIVWLALYLATRTVSVASMAAAATLPVAVAALERRSFSLGPSATFIFAAGIAALIIFRHRSNIARLLRGEELKAGKQEPSSPAAPPRTNVPR